MLGYTGSLDPDSDFRLDPDPDSVNRYGSETLPVPVGICIIPIKSTRQGSSIKYLGMILPGIFLFLQCCPVRIVGNTGLVYISGLIWTRNSSYFTYFGGSGSATLANSPFLSDPDQPHQLPLFHIFWRIWISHRG